MTGTETERKDGTGLVQSLYNRSIGRVIWVVVSLVGVIPMLIVLHLGLVTWPARYHPGSFLGQTVFLLLFALFSLACGLYLVQDLTRRIRGLYSESVRLSQNTQSGGSPPSSGSAPYGLLFGAGGPRSENEIESLTASLGRLRTTFTENMACIERQAVYLENLERVLQDCQDMILTLDRDNNLTFSNRAAREVLGLVPDRNLRRALAEGRLTESDWERLASQLEPWRDAEEEVTLTGGSEGQPVVALHVRVTVQHRDSPNRSKIVLMRDLSEHKRLQRQLYRSERLALLGQLISGVAHELNNPLAAVLGLAELSRDSKLAPADLQHNLEVIDREARRTACIVQDLLDFSRQKNPVRLPSDARELMDRCFGLLAYSFRTNDITVQKHYDPSLPPVTADQYQIQQVFMNIIINAAQAMLQSQLQKPVIEVSTRRSPDDQFVFVEIADNGPGIPPTHLARIFEPFFSTKKDQGTGLGLPISQGIVRQHGGDLTVYNRPEGGACFRVALPITRSEDLALALSAPAPVEDTHAAQASAAGARVLVVDDELSVLDMASQALAQAGLHVLTAETVKGAVRLLETTAVDLVITDVRMPDGDGLEIWHYIQKNHARLANRVVFVTGDPQMASRLRARLGVDVPALLKPFHVGELCRVALDRLAVPLKT